MRIILKVDFYIFWSVDFVFDIFLIVFFSEFLSKFRWRRRFESVNSAFFSRVFSINLFFLFLNNLNVFFISGKLGFILCREYFRNIFCCFFIVFLKVDFFECFFKMISVNFFFMEGIVFLGGFLMKIGKVFFLVNNERLRCLRKMYVLSNEWILIVFVSSSTFNILDGDD